MSAPATKANHDRGHVPTPECLRGRPIVGFVRCPKPPFSLTGTVSALDLQSIPKRIARKGDVK